MNRPPGNFRATWVLLNVSLRRMRNLWSVNTLFSGLKKKPAQDARVATPSKYGPRNWAGTFLMIFGMFLIMGNLGLQGVGVVFTSLNQSPYAEPRTDRTSFLRDAVAEVQNVAFDTLDAFQAYLEEQAQPTEGTESEIDDGYEDAGTRTSRPLIRRRPSSSRGVQTRDSGLMIDIVVNRRQRPNFTPDALVTRGAGVLSLVLAMSLLFSGGDFGKVQESGLAAAMGEYAWTTPYPISTGAILSARLLRAGFLDVFGWMILLPVYFFIFISAGFGWIAAPLALGASVGIKLMSGGLSLLIRVTLPLVVRQKTATNILGVFTGLGMICYFAFLSLANFREPLSWLAPWVARLPSTLLYLPPLAPGLMTQGGAATILGLSITLLGGTLVGMGSVFVADFLLQRGKEKAHEEARRKTPVADASLRSFPNGALRTGILVVFRNRAYLLQLIYIPILIIAYNGLTHFQNFVQDPNSFQFSMLALTAYVAGAYTTLFGSTHAVTSAIPGLWMLYTLPRPLSASLMRTSLVSGIFSFLYPLLILGFGLWILPFSLHNLSLAILSLGCVAAMVMISGGLMMLGVDPHATETNRSIDAVYTLFLMMISGMPIASFFSESLWQHLVIMLTMGLIGLALWEKVADRGPYMLDPAEKAPPRLMMSDGLLSAAVFIALQGTLLVILHLGFKLDLSLSLSWSFWTAGILTLIGSAISLKRRHIPDVMQCLGLRAMPNAGPVSRALGLGLAAGLLATVFGVGYLYLLQTLPWLAPIWEMAKVPDFELDFQRPAIILLIVVGAPLVEESLFRGLLHNGLARSVKPIWAILGSSLIFAFAHPAVSVPPVFFLGVLTACVYRRSGRLLSAWVAHAVYNGLILFLQ
ncbi:MAG: CPBP family intramembrane metalloprotease [Verrucomicrobia bacterium]|nr:CPBP family intramembrane metalloprotease [Verrucomicrobiota bacterium]MCH8510884.1 CPBP family intramembrane metalloprotease [Kiritimatiellia bacterium]